jgi:tRNA-2-methylthio-N6-dimethylallyladenosine synthase
VASQEGEAIIQRAPYVDVVFGPQTLHRLPELLRERERQARPQVDVSFPEIEKFDHLPPARVEGASAFVSIMEGCSKYCSYCVVPYTRGEEVSRPLEDVLVEVAGLAEQGVKEGVTPAGAKTSTLGAAATGEGLCAAAGMRGRDSGHRAHPLHHQPPQRIHAAPDRGVRADPATGQPTCTYPYSTAATRILMAMKRGYTAMEYKSTVRKLRAVRPDLSLSSDFIVGFPRRDRGRLRQAHEAG